VGPPPSPEKNEKNFAQSKIFDCQKNLRLEMRVSITHRVANVVYIGNSYSVTIYKAGTCEYVSLADMINIFTASFRTFAELRGYIGTNVYIRDYQRNVEDRKRIQTDFVNLTSVSRYLVVECGWAGDKADSWLAPSDDDNDALERLVIDRLIDFWEPIVIAALQKSHA
jgi:hypothetical protein